MKMGIKQLVIELRPSVGDFIDLSKIKIEKESNAIIIKIPGFTYPADLLTSYVSYDPQSSEGSPT
jgi:hypothetical protein